MEDLAHVPAHTLAHDRLAAAQAVEDLQRALGPADRARADAHRVVVVEHQHRDVVLREVDRRGEADRAGADDDHRMMDAVAVLVRRAAVGVDRVGVRLHRTRPQPFERFPHLLVALRGPDPRVADTASPRRRRASRRTAGSGRRSPSGRTSASAPRRSPGRRCAGPCPPPRPPSPRRTSSVTKARVPSRPALTASGVCSAAPRPGTSFCGCSAAMCVERLRPVGEVGVARVGRRVVLDEVAREQDLLLRQPDHGVALGVAASQLHDLDLQLAEPQRQPLLEHERSAR